VPILLTLGTGWPDLDVRGARRRQLNLVSVGFGILFIGIAVDFAIQFTVRFREVRTTIAELARR